ncbi:MAG: hypothetical protein Q9226_007631, partial [Calogaya cf. arnoldii]
HSSNEFIHHAQQELSPAEEYFYTNSGVSHYIKTVDVLYQARIVHKSTIAIVEARKQETVGLVKRGKDTGNQTRDNSYVSDQARTSIRRKLADHDFSPVVTTPEAQGNMSGDLKFAEATRTIVGDELVDILW